MQYPPKLDQNSGVAVPPPLKSLLVGRTPSKRMVGGDSEYIEPCGGSPTVGRKSVARVRKYDGNSCISWSCSHEVIRGPVCNAGGQTVSAHLETPSPGTLQPWLEQHVPGF